MVSTVVRNSIVGFTEEIKGSIEDIRYGCEKVAVRYYDKREPWMAYPTQAIIEVIISKTDDPVYIAACLPAGYLHVKKKDENFKMEKTKPVFSETLDSSLKRISPVYESRFEKELERKVNELSLKTEEGSEDITGTSTDTFEYGEVDEDRPSPTPSPDLRASEDTITTNIPVTVVTISP